MLHARKTLQVPQQTERAESSEADERHTEFLKNNPPSKMRPKFPKEPRFRHSAKGFRVSALPFEAKEAPPPPEEAPRFRAKRRFRDDASGHYRPTNHHPNTDRPNRPDCAHRKADGR